MLDPEKLESEYQKYTLDLKEHVPDGILEIDHSILEELAIVDDSTEDSSLFHSFYVVESSEKLTLFNQKFVIWIVPKLVDDKPMTFTLIALNQNSETRLEMAFSTKEEYNHSNLILKVLEKFLDQIEENETEMDKIMQS